MNNENKKLIMRYAILATQNLQANITEPTEEMDEIAKKLNLGHNQIIKLAAQLTGISSENK